MELSKQVVSFELSKRLKELGVKQESAFYWEIQNDEVRLFRDDREGAMHPTFPAFTVAELGELLPSGTCSNVFNYRNGKPCERYYRIFGGYDDGHPFEFESRNEADARTLALIYLVEKGIMEP